jgi:hypothetical protein
MTLNSNYKQLEAASKSFGFAFLSVKGNRLQDDKLTARPIYTYPQSGWNPLATPPYREHPFAKTYHANQGTKKELFAKERAVHVTSSPIALLEQPPTDTELAIRLFSYSIRRLSGVLSIRENTGSSPSERSFLITVPSLFDTAVDKIYRLRGDVFRKYPKAKLEVQVLGKREMGSRQRVSVKPLK